MRVSLYCISFIQPSDVFLITHYLKTVQLTVVLEKTPKSPAL